jgi:hypothetical protein
MADHPSDDTWERYATGALDGAERDELHAHVVACARCARTWKVMRHVAREAHDFDAEAPVPAPPLRDDAVVIPFPVPLRAMRRALYAIGGVAFAAAAVMIAWIALGRGSLAESYEPYNGTLRGDAPATPGIELAAGTAARVAWQPVAGADRYAITLFTFDGRVLWTREVTAAVLEIAPPLAAGRYRWQVEAWTGGRRIASSAPALLVADP